MVKNVNKKYDESMKLNVTHSSISSPLVLCVVSFEMLSYSSMNPLYNIQTNHLDHSDEPNIFSIPKQKIIISNMKVIKFAARQKQRLSFILMSH